MVIVKQGQSSRFYGFRYEQFDGEPCISDPAGCMKGWALAIGLPFAVISFRRIRDSGRKYDFRPRGTGILGV